MTPTLALIGFLLFGSSAKTASVAVHGHVQTVHVYGTPGNRPAIVSSGDGGWINLAPHVAELLASHGWYVIGFDTRAYLSGMTDANRLSVGDVPRDYERLVSLARAASPQPPLLIGVSEGAGLSVAAAADPEVKRSISGVVAIGLGDRNELAWHLRDAIIYLTKGVPREPLFHATEFVGRVSPQPFAMLRSTGDEFVGPEESDRLVGAARQPKATWTITADDHRFTHNLPAFDTALLEAISWAESRASDEQDSSS